MGSASHKPARHPGDTLGAPAQPDMARRQWLQQAAALSLGATGLLGWGAAAHAQGNTQAASLVLGDQAGGLRALFEASRTLEGAPFA